MRSATSSIPPSESRAAAEPLRRLALLAAERQSLGELPARLADLLDHQIAADRIDLYLVLNSGGILHASWPTPEGEAQRVKPLGRPPGMVANALLESRVTSSDNPEAEAEGLRSGMAVPLRFGGDTLGAVAFRSLIAGAYDEDDRSLAAELAPALSACVAASRSSADEGSLEVAETIAEVGTSLTLGLDAGASFELFCAAVAKLIPFDHVAVTLNSSRRGMLELFLQTERKAEGDARHGNRDRAEPLALAQSALGIVVATEAPLMVGDIAADPRFCGALDRRMVREGRHSFLAVPLRIEGRVIGVLAFSSNQPDTYEDEDLARALRIADRVALPIHGLRVTGLARAQGAIEERGRLSRSFADTVQPSFARALGLLERNDAALSAETVEECREHLLRASLGIRTAIAGDAGRLSARLDELIETVGRAWGVDTGFIVSGTPTALLLDSETALEDAARAAIGALARYRRSWRVDVELEFLDESVRLTIVDEGHASVARSGLDSAFALARARVEEEGGRLNVLRSSMLRTKLEISFPLQQVGALEVVACASSPILRSGVTSLLRSVRGIELVGVVEDQDQLVNACRALKPAVAVIALGGPVTPEAAAAFTWLRDATPNTRCLVLAPTVETWDVEACLHAGAHGCLADDVSPTALGDALRMVARGEVQVPPPISDVIFQRYVHLMADESGRDALSQREIEVLALLVQGLKNREIAEHLVITQHTVKSHVARIFQKLGVTDRASAVRVALLRRMVPEGSAPGSSFDED